MFTKIRELRRNFNELPFPVQLAAISPAIAVLMFLWISFYLSTPKLTDKKDIIQVKEKVLQFTSQILLGAAGLSAAYFAWQRLEVSREDQITDRYTRAIDQLGSEKLEIRLGGIYALDRIAKDSRKDLESILKIFTAFIREDSSAKKTNKNEISKKYFFLETDVQAVITLLGESNYSTKSVGNEYRFNLALANLGRAFLYDLNLSNTLLYGANLSKSYLVNANLSGANLREADLNGANLSRADLSEANLSKAYLSEANLSKANLRGAKEINLDQIKEAKNWEQATYSDDFKAKLGLATSPEESTENPAKQPSSQN